MRISLLDHVQGYRHRIAQAVASVMLFGIAGATVNRTVESPVAASPPAWDLANIDNPRVDSWVHRFTSSMKSEFGATLDRGAQFDSMITSKLTERVVSSTQRRMKVPRARHASVRCARYRASVRSFDDPRSPLSCAVNLSAGFRACLPSSAFHSPFCVHRQLLS